MISGDYFTWVIEHLILIFELMSLLMKHRLAQYAALVYGDPLPVWPYALSLYSSYRAYNMRNVEYQGSPKLGIQHQLY